MRLAIGPPFLDWANVPGPFDWIGLLLAVVGFTVTIVQLCRSAGALKAAKAALENTRESLTHNQLLGILPQFQSVGADMDHAINGDSRDVAHRTLVRYGDVATETATLLGRVTEGYEPLVARLNISVGMALDAKEALFLRPEDAVGDVVSSAATEIRKISAEIVGVTASVRNNPKVSVNV